MINWFNKGKLCALGTDFKDYNDPKPELTKAIKRISGLSVKQKDLQFKGVVKFLETNRDLAETIYVFECNKFTGRLKNPKNGKLYWVNKKLALSKNLCSGDKHALLQMQKQPTFFKTLV